MVTLFRQRTIKSNYIRFINITIKKSAMRTIFLILSFTMIVSICVSQELKLQTGMAMSSFKLKESKLSFGNIFTPLVAIGIDYVESKKWYLSSEISFFKTGTNEKIINIPIEGNKGQVQGKYSWPTLCLNNSFRIKIPSGKDYFFCGLGPSLQIVLNDKVFDDAWIKEIERCNLGLNAHIGYKFKLSHKVNLEIMYSYIFSITPVGKDVEGSNFHSRTSLFSISLSHLL